MKPIEVDLGFTRLEIGDRYVIARTAHGMDIGIDEHEKAMSIIAEHTEFPFALVLDEVNSYSVKLETMMKLRDETRIDKFAVICYRPSTRIAHSFGSKIVRRPVTFFNSREQARDWLKQQTA